MPLFSRKSGSNRDSEAPAKSEKRADKTEKSSSRPHDRSSDSRRDQSSPSAVELLMADHRLVESLFSDLESAEGDAGKVALAQRICTELSIHAELEERIFYPAAREAIVHENPAGEAQGHDPGGIVDEAIVEHRTLKMLIAEIDASSPKSPFFDANLTVLKEYVQHHVKEEERSMLPAVQATDLDLVALGKRIEAMKKKLQASVELTKPPRAGARPVVHVPAFGSKRAAGSSTGGREARAAGGSAGGRRASAPKARASTTSRAASTRSSKTKAIPAKPMGRPPESKSSTTKAGTVKASRPTAGSTRAVSARSGARSARGVKRAATKVGAKTARSRGSASAVSDNDAKTSARRVVAKRASASARGGTASTRTSAKRKASSTRSTRTREAAR